MREELLGAGHPAVAVSLANLAFLQCELDRFPDAEASYRRGLEIGRRGFPPQSPGLAYPLLDFARCRMRQERYAAAEPLLREALEIRRRALAADSELIRVVEEELRRCLRALGRPDEAEAL